MGSLLLLLSDDIYVFLFLLILCGATKESRYWSKSSKWKVVLFDGVDQISEKETKLKLKCE